MDISREIAGLYEEMVALRRDFHQHPELGLQEHRTSKIVEEYLMDLGLTVKRCLETGVIGVLNGEKPGKTLMLRCDMDALPVEEETGLPFASQNKGVMHACGHDGHTAMLLITAKIMAAMKKDLQGTVVFLFQPNEEDAGAERMIQEGAMEHPTPDAVCGLHLWTPVETGKIGIVPGPIMASSYYFKMNIYGKGGHGGAPHTAINPIDTAAHVLEAIKTFHTLELNALKPTVISVCKIHGGTKQIVVPDSVCLEGSIRCLHNEDAAVRQRFQELLSQVCSAYRCTCDFEFECGNTVLSNDPYMTELAMEVAAEVVGKDNIQTKDISVMLGDDFAEFSRRTPGVYYFVGTGNEEKKTNYEHHNSRFDIDEASLKTGVEMQVRLVLKYLNGQG